MSMSRREIMKLLSSIPGVTAIERLSVDDIDAIVISCDYKLHPEQAKRISEAWKRTKIGQRVELIVLEEGLKIQVLKRASRG